MLAVALTPPHPVKILALKRCVFLAAADVVMMIDAKTSATAVGDAVGTKHAPLERLFLDGCTIEDFADADKGSPMPSQITRADILALRAKYESDGVRITLGSPPRAVRTTVGKIFLDAHRVTAVAAFKRASGRKWASPSDIQGQVDAMWARLDEAGRAEWTAKVGTDAARFEREQAEYMG